MLTQKAQFTCRFDFSSQPWLQKTNFHCLPDALSILRRVAGADPKHKQACAYGKVTSSHIQGNARRTQITLYDGAPQSYESIKLYPTFVFKKWRRLPIMHYKCYESIKLYRIVVFFKWRRFCNDHRPDVHPHIVQFAVARSNIASSFHKNMQLYRFVDFKKGIAVQVFLNLLQAQVSLNNKNREGSPIHLEWKRIVSFRRPSIF